MSRGPTEERDCARGFAWVFGTDVCVLQAYMLYQKNPQVENNQCFLEESSCPKSH